jgi:O-antigen/teichoic acid export membrane protein
LATVTAPEHPAVTASNVSTRLLRSVVRNAVSLTLGRIVLALLRFGVAIVIVQRAGLGTFGEFALILSFVLVAEWLSDFGLVDIAVRQIASDPARAEATMGAFTVSKAAQGIVAAGVMVMVIALLGYSGQILRSGLIAGGAVILYAWVQVYRVQFRTRMQMGRDVGAEVIAGLVFLLAVWIVTGTDASLEMLALCYVISRAVNLIAAALLAGARPALSFGKDFRAELRVLAIACIPLGFSGLMVSAYDAMDAIALSQWSTSAEVGIFTVAARIVMLAVIVEQALATAVFPLLSRQWARDRESFVRTYQAVLDWGMVAAGALFCAVHAGAFGLGELAKQDPHAIATVLQVLAWAILARVIVTLIGPMVVISGRLHYVVWIQVTIVATKGLALMALAPQGALGAAHAYLIAEIGIGLLPAVYFSQRAAGIWLHWLVPLKCVAAAVVVAVTTRLLGLDGSLLHGALATTAYLVLAAAMGAVRIEPLRQFYLSLAQDRGGRV